MIEVRNLGKRYGPVEAVRSVSFKVDSGQIVGLLGPNGAGKTTIMKILTCFHFPSSGEAFVDGVSVEEDPVAVKRRVGYLPENAPLYGDMTVDEYLAFVADVRAIPAAGRAGAIERAIAACGLDTMRRKPIEELSKGFRQRVGLAQAIVHDPSILILDEPTSGLDPNQILEIRALIRELGKSKTVILSTHILQEVEAVCSRVLILNDGRIAAQGTPEEIAASFKGEESWDLTAKLAGPAVLADKVAALEGFVLASPAEDLGGGFCRFRLIAPASEAAAAATSAAVEAAPAAFASGERIFAWAVAQGIAIVGMARNRVSLEDIFVRLTAEGEGL